MKTLTFVLALLLVGVAGLGFYRGWFTIVTDNTDQQSSATITVDKDRIHADEQKAKDKAQSLGQETKDKVQDAGQEAKEEIGDRAGNAEEPERGR
ncbi:MAG TPA: hypothetical protein VJL29_00770 [Thermoguttaceae bacterium]|nr:hypothetical protein [Thermoguttaceae bacterium]